MSNEEELAWLRNVEADLTALLARVRERIADLREK
jgi:hypothetical protein